MIKILENGKSVETTSWEYYEAYSPKLVHKPYEISKDPRFLFLGKKAGIKRYIPYFQDPRYIEALGWN